MNATHNSTTVAKLQLKRKRKDPAVAENADVSLTLLTDLMFSNY